MNFSHFSALVNGAQRTADLSSAANALEIVNLQLNGSTSGNVVISASATTTDYTLVMPDAQAAGSGYVLTNDGSGVLSWSPTGATGANTSLSNLSLIAINESLTPGTDNSIDLGSASKSWATAYLTTINFPSVETSITADGYLVDSASLNSVGWQTRELIDESTNTQLSWTADGVEFNQLTASTVPYLDASKVLTSSSVTPTELGYVSGVTSAIQLQFSGKLSLSGGTMTGNIDMGTFYKVTGLLAGDSTGDAVAFQQLSNYVPTSSGNAAGGYPVLDGAGKVAYAQLPSALMTYKGAWYAAATYAFYTGTLTGTSTPVTITADSFGVVGNSVDLAFNGILTIDAEISAWNLANPSNTVTLTSGDGSQIPDNGTDAQLANGHDAFTPTLVDGVGTNGDVYRAATAGTYDFGSGPITFAIGDFVIYNGTIWQHSPAADGVSSVNGNTGAVTVNAINQLTGDVTASAASQSESKATTVAAIQGTTVSGTTGSGNVVFSTSPTLVTPALGTPSALVGTNITGTASGLTAGSVTTNANLTGPITSVGNATAIASQTGTGTTFAMSASPTFTGTVAADIIAATGAVSGSNLSGTNTGNVTLTAVGAAPSANGATLSGQALTLQPADATHPGVLTATDWNTFNNKGSGTVTAVSVASANGFAGSSSGGATPALTISTSITGVLKGDGTAISAATAGTDYSAGTSGLSTGILKSTTATGALTIAVAGDFPTLNQDSTGSAGSLVKSFNAGETFASQTSFAVRMSIQTSSETVSQVRKADNDATTIDNFWVVGMAMSAAGVSAGAAIPVTMNGLFTLGSSDTPFNSTDIGKPVFLGTSGAFTMTAPTAASAANTKIGIVFSTTQIAVAPQVMGVA